MEFSVLNTSVGVISSFIALFMGYVLRVVFTHTMSESYVGLNGLFIDIVNILSLSELGIGAAMMFALYRPIVDEDIEKQKALMRLLRNFYRLVVVLVAVMGCALIPFLWVLIKDYSEVEHLTLIYILYLVNTASSYLLVYKKTLLDAHQRMYITVFFQMLSWTVQDILKIIVLVIWHDFILFMLVGIACTLAGNIIVSKIADRYYPYLKDKEVKPLPAQEKKKIYQNIRAMMMHKIGGVVVNNTDNLILSACTGLLSVGSYSNYYLVIGAVGKILTQIYQGITASVGNLGAAEDEKHVEKVFDASVFIGQWIYGVAFIGLFELLNPFVCLSFGEQYMFPKETVFVICLNFYLVGQRDAVRTFKDSMGLFWYDRYKAVLEAGLNILFSLIFVKYMGVIGVFLGTTISMLLTTFWVEPFVLYKHGFKSSCKGYFLREGIYCAMMAVVWLITDFLCNMAVRSVGNLYAEIFIRLLLCVIIADALLLLIYFWTDNFKFVMNLAVGFIKDKFGAGKKNIG